jgi:hypothetical protein
MASRLAACSHFLSFALLGVAASAGYCQAPSSTTSDPIAAPDLVFAEKEGLVSVEAEHFIKQEHTSVRSFHVTHSTQTPKFNEDADPPHVEGASGGAYLEILPDTRMSSKEKLIQGENFSEKPGELAVLTYRVYFATAGRYYVWARAFSSGAEDNSLHVGIDNTWPESGRRLQWCEGKNSWRWESKQRTEQVHCGEPYKIFLDVSTPGIHSIHFSLREDGFEFDKWLMTTNREFARPDDVGPSPVVHQGAVPKTFPFIQVVAKEPKKSVPPVAPPMDSGKLAILASQLATQDTGYYLDKKQWLAIDPNKNESARIQTAFPYPSGRYDITLFAVGEEDGQSTYQVLLNDSKVGEFRCPLSGQQFEEGPSYTTTWQNREVNSGDVFTLMSQIASKDGKEFSRARIARLEFVPADDATRKLVANLKTASAAKASSSAPLVLPRKPNGNAGTVVSGELKQWHKVSVTLDGPFANELDNDPNPFTDYAMSVLFEHESGQFRRVVPGYFAADGSAAESSADSGTKWRAHLSPDLPGKWNYSVSFMTGKNVALQGGGKPWSEYHDRKGSFTIAASDKTGNDFRARGRLTYVGKRYLQFAGTKEYFLKAGADSPETLLAFADFDNMQALKVNVPLKTYKDHVADWKPSDPSWKSGKGKGLIGAINYLADKGVNSISFLTYNAAGDGDNIWPFVGRDDKLHWDCSKLDQWGVVLDHASQRGLYLHFKLQENEMDDNRRGDQSVPAEIPESLDGGILGIQRKLYCRELIARFSHALALNWNIGEENTQSTSEIQDMVRYLHETDPYQHNIVIHTFPNQQEKVYRPLLGKNSLLTGVSLQNAWNQAHKRTIQWIRESDQAGRAWIIAQDEQNPASDGVPADPGYRGNDGFATMNGKKYTMHDIRKACLWGTFLAGGAGVEYYFGYKLPENDLVLQDFRSRDKTWDYCRIAIDFFRDQKIPVNEMSCSDELIGNTSNDNSKYCFAKPGELYLVYLPDGGTTQLDLRGATGDFKVQWFNPRTGGALVDGSQKAVKGSAEVDLGQPPSEANEDWLVVVKK